MGNSCTPANIVAFHHTALFSMAISTLTTALHKGFIPPLPGLSVALLRKYTPNLEATAMGHMDNIRKKHKVHKKSTVQGQSTPNHINRERGCKRLPTATSR
jgi:hypothetical protein